MSARFPLLAIAAELSAPPSSPSVFRDVGLYATVFRRYEVIAVSPPDMIDFYDKWFRRYGAWDYISDLVPPEWALDADVELEGGAGSMLTAHNLNVVLSLL